MARLGHRRAAAALRCVALALALGAACAHRPLLTGPTGGADYSTWQTALAVPWVTSSWSVKRIADCEHPVFWMKFSAESANQDLHLTAGTPAAAGLAALRPGLALFGPGLPPYDASKLGFAAPPSKPGFGMLRISSPKDQSNCAFLENAVSKGAYKPSDFAGTGRRCGFYEPFGRTWLWITADKNTTLPVKGGTYYLASFLDNSRTTGRYTVAIANWAETEDFRRPYTLQPGNRADVKYADPAATAACCPAAGGAAGTKAAPAAAVKGGAAACTPWQAFGA